MNKYLFDPETFDLYYRHYNTVAFKSCNRKDERRDDAYFERVSFFLDKSVWLEERLSLPFTTKWYSTN